MLKFNIICAEAPRCLVSYGAAQAVVSRCLNQTSTKEDVKIMEDAVISFAAFIELGVGVFSIFPESHWIL